MSSYQASFLLANNRCSLLSAISYLVTMGSAAWFGPHRPKYPRPRMPVRPTGFLKIKQSTKKCTKCLKVYNSSKSTLLTLMQLFIVLTTSLIIKSAGTLNIMSTASTKQFMSLQQSEKCSSLLLVKTFP